MKKSQKLTAPFAAVLTFSLILSGCSSKNAKEPSTAVETAEERETPEENKSPEESDTAAGSDKKARIPQHLMTGPETALKTRFLIF